MLRTLVVVVGGGGGDGGSRLWVVFVIIARPTSSPFSLRSAWGHYVKENVGQRRPSVYQCVDTSVSNVVKVH